MLDTLFAAGLRARSLTPSPSQRSTLNEQLRQWRCDGALRPYRCGGSSGFAIGGADAHRFPVSLLPPEGRPQHREVHNR